MLETLPALSLEVHGSTVCTVDDRRAIPALGHHRIDGIDGIAATIARCLIRQADIVVAGCLPLCLHVPRQT